MGNILAPRTSIKTVVDLQLFGMIYTKLVLESIPARASTMIVGDVVLLNRVSTKLVGYMVKNRDKSYSTMKVIWLLRLPATWLV